MAGRFYGIEWIDDQVGGVTVSEARAALAFVVGTADVGAVHTDLADRAAHINEPILIRTKEEAIAAFGPRGGGFSLPQALDQLLSEAGPKGIGRIVAVNVYDPDVHTNGVGDVTAADVIGTFDAGGVPSGLQVAYTLFNRFGGFAKFIDVPGFSLAAGVRSALSQLCLRTRARSALNAPAGVNVQQAIEARGPGGDFDLQTADRRLSLLWPRMRATDPDTAGQTILVPYSSTFLGVWMRTVQERGWHYSPSNWPILGMEEGELDVVYIPGDTTSDPFLLRDAGLVTTEERWGQGMHTSGNRSAAWPTDTDIRNLMHVQLSEDVLIDALTLYLEQFKDRPGGAARLESIEEGANDYLGEKTQGNDPEISGGRFRFDRKLTTANTVAGGKFVFDLDWAPIGLMEHIQTRHEIDLSLLGNPLGLAA